MRHFLTIIGLLLLLCCPAQGESILGNLLTADGNVDSMNDNSRSLILDAQQEGQPGYNVLSEGDQVVGILQLERINHVDPSPSGVFAIFAFELADTYVYDNDTFYQCRPIQSGDTNSLRSLLDDDLEPAGFSNWDSALFAFLEIDELGVNDPKDPFSQLNTGAAVNPFDVMTNVLAQSNGYRVDMITGFGNQSDFLTLRELVSFALVS
ncbi:MAG: hypothetical protein JW888_18325, partial [Pirellulales bacterium]|nr:hypothetical protein [Pirellulales bacterium]